MKEPAKEALISGLGQTFVCLRQNDDNTLESLYPYFSDCILEL